MLEKGQKEFHYHCLKCGVDFVSLKWSTGAIELLWKNIEELNSDVEFLKQQMEALRKK